MFQKLCLVIVLSGIIFTASSKAALTVNATDPVIGVSPAPKTVSCFTNDGTVAMEGNVPNPYDCTTFYTCREVEPGYPEPQLMHCQNGHLGTPLYYDFVKCWCEEREIAVCYDFEDEQHKQGFFGCAVKLESWNGNNLRK